MDYDAPNFYCTDTGDWPPAFTCSNQPPASEQLEISDSGGVIDTAYIYFENGSWDTGILAPCPGTSTYTAKIIYLRQGGTVQKTVTKTETLTTPCAAPATPQNGSGCSNPTSPMASAGSAVGPGNVPIGVNGGPAFSEAPVAGPLAPVFSYNGGSLDSDAGVSPGWFFTYGETLVSDWPGRLVWTDLSGFHRYYSGSDASGYVASYPGDALGTVSRSGSDYALALPDGTIRTFVALSGYWKATVDRWGNGAQGNATAASRPTLVQELLGGAISGRQLSLGYTGGQLTTVTDAALGVSQLGYDSSKRLSTICAADQACPSPPPAHPWRTYGYEGVTNRLTIVTDAGDSVIRGYEWNAAGGIQSTWIGASTYAAGKERATFTQTGSAVLVSRYIDGTNTADTTYTVESIAGVNRVTQISGACPECGAENSTNTFDPTTGRLLTRVNGNGFLTRFQYDTFGNLDQLTEAEGTAVERSTTWAYAVPGVDPLPASWPSTVRDFWILKTEPSGAKAGSSVEMSRSFDGVGNLVLNETVSGYLSSSDSTATSRSTETTLDTHGHPLVIDGPRNDVSDLATLDYYDSTYPVAARGRLKRRTEPDLTETTFDSYHALGGTTHETRKLRSGASDADIVTERTFDARGRLLTQTIKATSAAETDIVTTTGYDARGRTSYTQVQPAGGAVTTRTNLVYEDGTDRLLTRTLTTTQGGPGDRITYGYDDRGNVTSERYGHFNGVSTTEEFAVDRAYDGQCRVKRQTYPADDAMTAYTYDCVGNVTHVKDALHATSNLIYDYDERNRLTTVTRTASPTNDLTTYYYDDRDQLVQVTDPNGAATFYVFDDFGQMRRKTTALSGGGYNDITTYSYDEGGNLTAEQSADRGTTRSYDAAGRLLSISNDANSPSLSISYTYDSGCDPDPVSGHVLGQGRLCRVTDETGTKVNAYDRRGLLVTESKEFGLGIVDSNGYRYDAAGRRSDIFYSDGSRTTSTLDGAGRVTAMSFTPSGGAQQALLSGVTHKPFGPTTGFTTAAGTVETRTYDTRYRRLSQATQKSGQILAAYAYGDGMIPSTAFDKEGNLLSLNDVTPGSGSTFNRTFFYDPDRSFLTSATGPFASSYSSQTITWTTDKIGNRLTESRTGLGTTIYTYGNDGSGHSNGVLTVITSPGGPAANVASLSSGDLSQDDQGLFHSYDSLGRLTSVRGNSCGPRGMVSFGQFSHDASNHLFQRTVGCSGFQFVGTEEFVHGADGLLYERSTFLGGNPAKRSTDRFVYLDGEPVAMLRANATYYLHNDHLGRPIAMTDSVGQLVWRPEYEPFGKSLAPRLSFSDPPGFRFPGQWESADSGDLTGGTDSTSRIRALTDNWHRTYFQRWGRYTQPDPIFSAESAYAYARNRPLTFIDPLGLRAIFYDGCRARYIDDAGNTVKVCLASSGQTGSGPGDQGTPKVGPLPEGHYYLDPRTFTGGRIRSVFRSPGWGIWRAPLTPAPGTDTRGRDGFFFHGDTRNRSGSQGCLDVGDCDTWGRNWAMQDPDNVIDVFVRYGLRGHVCN